MKPGDIVICIDNNVPKANEVFTDPVLTIGKKYKVRYYPKSNDWTIKPWIIIDDDIGNKQSVMKYMFISLDDWREKIINEIIK